MKIQIVQHDIDQSDLRKNLAGISALLTDGADLIVLSEMFNCGFTADAVKHTGADQQLTIDWMRQEAERHNCLICGSLAYAENGTTYNRLCVADANGIRAHYDKRHLFSMGGVESTDQYAAGANRTVVEVGGMRCLLQICYDLRFPVWSRYRNDYDTIIYVANWPASRTDVWLTLLKARAIENQCYTVGVNRIGTDGNIDYSGKSIIFGPRGEIIAQTTDNEQQSMIVELPLEPLLHFRKRFRVLADADNFTIL
ncbi:MAG: nitrilase family protein [Bacteroidales bacterium]|nr:nitrilase family protein [Bacteroidales bacterium]